MSFGGGCPLLAAVSMQEPDQRDDDNDNDDDSQ